MPRTNGFLLFLLFVAALLIRLVFVLDWQETPYGVMPLLDAHAYHSWAIAISEGHLLRDSAFYQSPLYPYVLGLFYALFGPSLFVASCLNAFLGAFTCLILYRLTFRLYGSTAAWTAALLAAFYKPFIFFSAPCLKEPLSLFLLALFLDYATQAYEKNKSKDYSLAALFLGLSCLTRGNLLLLFPLSLAIFLWRYRQQSLSKFLIFSFVFLLSLTPSLLHNWSISGDPVLLTYNGGFNLYVGNSPSANAASTGINAYPPNISSDPLGGEEKDTALLVRHDIGHFPSPSEISAYWTQKALSFIEENPFFTLEHLFRKTVTSFDQYEIPDNYDQTFFENNFPTILRLPLPGFAFVFALAVFALLHKKIRQDSQTRFLLIQSFFFLLSVVIFYVSDRYRLPLLVFLLPVSGSAVSAAVADYRTPAFPSMAFAGGIAFFAFALSLSNPFIVRQKRIDAHDWALVSWMSFRQRKFAEALTYFHKAQSVSESGAGAPAYLTSSVSAESLGLYAEAESYLKILLQKYPTWSPGWMGYARWRKAHNDISGAIEAAEKGVLLAPYDKESILFLSKLERESGRIEAAKITLEKGKNLLPEDQDISNALSEITPLR